MSALTVINCKTKPWQRSRFEKRPDEFIRDGERIKTQRTALKQHLAKQTASKSENRKGP
jgi:hypothetical protein